MEHHLNQGAGKSRDEYYLDRSSLSGVGWERDAPTNIMQYCFISLMTHASKRLHIIQPVEALAFVAAVLVHRDGR